MMSDFLRLQDKRYKRIVNCIKRSNISKLNQLKDSLASLTSTNDNVWLVNQSNVSLPQDIKSFLSLDPKFSLPISVKDIDMYTYLADIEYCIKELPTDSQKFKRSKITNIITYHIKTKRHYISTSMAIETKTRKFLKYNPDIVVTRAYKANTTVIMDRNEYITKSFELLNDPHSYKKSPKI
ncbi:uncharacterized protein [Diabrotica undecimpunctata]|uniref:uncharacterized protein n=1 Tax=Diabrotica undecimpunctata TaxID=50387 RepID=UPI003B63DA48